jgi:hypothetical protein
LKYLADRAQRELRIEAAFRVEADLARKDRAVMKPSSRHQGGGVEPGCRPPEAIWIARVV